MGLFPLQREDPAVLGQQGLNFQICFIYIDIMKLSISTLRRIIKEELAFVNESSDIVSRRPASLDSLVRRHKDPEKPIDHAVLRKGGLKPQTELTYHIVYGRIVGKLDGKDVEYWMPQNEVTNVGNWVSINDEMRHHPVSVHQPS